ncbi:MAG TPA: metallophosphoesterase [Candidatus Nanoarchaeia archaeon]|nr:metallophosphoesterase [Candidatus Nanoarchaeia archaeon]
MAGTNMLEVAFYGDPHGNFQGLELATRLMNQRGVKKRICLGDITVRLASELSRSQTALSEQFRRQLFSVTGPGEVAGSSYRQAIEEGLYSDQQLGRVSQPRKRQGEIVQRHARETYRRFREIDSTIETIGGNWDVEEPMRVVFEDKLHEDEITEDNGMKIAWATGGGSVPIEESGIMDGFFADNPEKGLYRSHNLRELLLTIRGKTTEENTIDLLVSHIPPPQEGRHVDTYARQLQDHLLRRYSVSLPLPKLLVHGHHHVSNADIAWRTYQDEVTGKKIEQLTFTPGVLALEHNDGSHGAFCIGKFDQGTKQLLSVEEYHVQKNIDGFMEVIYHGEHILDHQEKKITFNKKEQLVSREPLKKMFSFAELDANYALEKGGFSVNYNSLNPRELDEAVRLSLAKMSSYIADTKSRVKNVFDSVKNQWLRGKNPNDSFTDSELLEQQLHIADLLGYQAAEIFGVGLDHINALNEIEKTFYLRTMMNAAFGLTSLEIQQASDIDNKTYENVPFNWGAEAQQKAAKSVNNQIINFLIGNINGDKWAEIVDDVYAPLSVSRTSPLPRDKAMNLYSKGLNVGLLTEEDLLSTGAYTKKQSVSLNPKTASEIEAMFDLSFAEEDQFEGLPKASETDVIALKRALDAGLRVIRSTKGDYLVTPKGPVYLPPEIQEKTHYIPTSISTLLDRGEATLVQGGDTYLLHYQGTNLPVDLQRENINPNKYLATPLWQMIQKSQEEQEKEKQKLADSFREMQAQEGRLHLPENKLFVPPGVQKASSDEPLIIAPNDYDFRRIK